MRTYCVLTLFVVVFGASTKAAHAQVTIGQGGSSTYMNSAGAGTGTNLTVHTGAGSMEVRNMFSNCPVTVEFRTSGTDTVIKSVTVTAAATLTVNLGSGSGALPTGGYDVYIKKCENGSWVKCGYLGVVSP